jgi:hypothetical protein
VGSHQQFTIFFQIKKRKKICFYIFCCLFKYFFYVLDVIANCLRLCGSKFSGRRPNFGRRFFIIKSDTEKIIFFMAPEPGKNIFLAPGSRNKNIYFFVRPYFCLLDVASKGFCLWKVLFLSLEGLVYSILNGFFFGMSCLVASIGFCLWKVLHCRLQRVLSFEGPVFVFGRSCLIESKGFCLWSVLFGRFQRVLSLEGPALSPTKGFVF